MALIARETAPAAASKEGFFSQFFYWLQGGTKRCRLSLLTNTALVIRVQMWSRGGVEGSQPMSTSVHIMWHGAQINFGDLSPYLSYDWLHSYILDWPSLHIFRATFYMQILILYAVILAKFYRNWPKNPPAVSCRICFTAMPTSVITVRFFPCSIFFLFFI
jgi:hypothetical protein